MDQSAEQCRFVEAEVARLKIAGLREEINQDRKTDLKSQHNEEHQEIAKTFSQEQEEFDAFWDQKLNEYKYYSDLLQTEMNAKHAKELADYQSDLERGLPVRSKDSQALLVLKQRRETLSKQKKFMEAAKVQREIETMEQQEQELFEGERLAKIQTQMAHLRNKQVQEMAALVKKVKTGVEEQARNRALEQERLEMKFKVVKKERQNKQVT